MSTLPEPLPSLENGNFEDVQRDRPRFFNTSGLWRGPRSEEQKQRIAEARANATPKSVYVKAILRHCRECFGKIPVREDCGGHELSDGTACNLYPCNTAAKCRHSTKTALKKAIRRECQYCGGEKSTCGKCSLQTEY